MLPEEKTKEEKGSLKALSKSKETQSLEGSLERMVEVRTKSSRSLDPVMELRRTVSRRLDNRGRIADPGFKNAGIARSLFRRLMFSELLDRRLSQHHQLNPELEPLT